MATPNAGFKVTDKDGVLLATYGHQSEVETYLASSFPGCSVKRPEGGRENVREVIDVVGTVVANIVGEFADRS